MGQSIKRKCLPSKQQFVPLLLGAAPSRDALLKGRGLGITLRHKITLSQGHSSAPSEESTVGPLHSLHTLLRTNSKAMGKMSSWDSWAPACLLPGLL